jgi:hypothetical protein
MSTPLDAVLAAAALLPDAGDMRIVQAREVAHAYAQVLARTPADRGELGDEDELPVAKDAIRHALLTLLDALPPPPFREALRLAYLRLADWQPRDVPSLPIDLKSARAGRDPIAMASRLAAARASPAERRRAASAQERGRLVEDLRLRGLG